MTDMEKLKATLAARRMRPARRIDGTVFLTGQVIAGLAYIAPEDFVKGLENLGATIDEVTLDITSTKALETAAEQPTATYTKEELEKLSWADIRTVAKADPKVPGNVNKDKMIELLTGRPKF